MKKILFAGLLLLAAAATQAQCDKKIILTASVTQYLGEDSSVQRSVDEATSIELDKNVMILIPGSEEKKRTGTIESFTCNWSTPFKDGITIVKTTLTNASGDARKMTITIEGKNGQITLHAVMDENPGRIIRLRADKFEEKK
ncbi:MAG: hypothetical protein H7Y27_15570 [Gemmatimonadaceae bacterium]|nr:hypothetical protein [Chitinophagaceae bacterium]